MGILRKLFRKSAGIIRAPLSGEVVALNQISDPAFGSGMLGKGVAIKPTIGKVVAPCTATVTTMFDMGHAVSLLTDFGAEILIHVGLDTVNLQGRHYSSHIKSGDKVKAGDLLMEFDQQAIQAEGYDTITPIIICNSGDFNVFKTFVDKTVAYGDTVIELAK